MVRRLSTYLLASRPANPRVLNLGAGAQAIEKQLRMNADSNHAVKRGGLRDRLKDSSIVTLDIAAIPARRLLNQAYTPHVRADSRRLPFQSGLIDMVISNHSIDMLRAEPAGFQSALGEVARVLTPEGRFDFALHHASLFPTLCSYYDIKGERSWQSLFYDSARQNPYYDSALDITVDFQVSGLCVTAVSKIQAGADTWWEVSGTKDA